MSDALPQGWAAAKLAGIAERITKGATPTSYGFQFLADGIAFVKVENLKRGFINKASIRHFISEAAHENQKRAILQEGDILFSIAGTIGDTCLVRREDLPANTNQALAIIRGTSQVFLPDFLRRQLESGVTRAQMRDKERGGGMHNISLEDVKEMQLLVPPLAEQRRIVAKLETLLGKVDASQQRLAKLPALLKRFRLSVLAAACSGRLTNDWRGSAAREGELPESWTLKKLFDICRPKQWKTISTKELTPTGYPVYGANGPIGFYAEFNHENPTILITCRGATCGRINISQSRSYLNGNAMALDDLDETVAILRFVAWSLESRRLDDTITGSAQPQITRASLEVVELAMPPLPEQQEIVQRVEGLFALADKLELRLAKAQKQVDQLTPSLLARAFAGKLVPQDPADEPASVLLERIKAEKSSAPPQRKGKVTIATGS